MFFRYPRGHRFALVNHLVPHITPIRGLPASDWIVIGPNGRRRPPDGLCRTCALSHRRFVP